jgi:N-methylhydantoinase B
MLKFSPPLEVLRHAFAGIAEEMGATLHRSAYTVVIKDLNDYSCAVFDAAGNLVAQGNNMPTHLGSMGQALRSLIAAWGDDVGPGDVFISNDPFDGGTHMPDVHIFTPVFDGDRRIAWAGNIAHHADWGGWVPGSMSVENKSTYEGGVIYPHVRLERAGKPNPDIYRLIAANVRQPELGLGDLRAQVASVRTAVDRFVRLINRYGSDILCSAMDRLIESSEARTRRAIAELPDGEYEASGYLDGNGVDNEPLRVRAVVTVSGSEVHVSFEGTAPQQPTAINVPLATTRSAVLFAMRTVLPDMPNTEGCTAPLTIHVPEGSLLNPEKPFPVSDRHLTSQRVADVLVRAFANAAPERASAGWFVGAGWMCCFPRSPKTGRPTMLLLNLAGGAGASREGGGASAVDAHMANATLIPAEVVESEYPLRVETYRLARGSGGAGRHKGGDGIHAEFTNVSHETIEMFGGMEQTNGQFGAWGADGGADGAPGYFAIRDHGVERRVAARSVRPLEPSQTFIVSTGGGGGYGAVPAEKKETPEEG